ncbi:MAG: hypothetical protein WHS86_06395 [Desulfosoma sp.]
MGKIYRIAYHGISICFSWGQLSDGKTVSKEVPEPDGKSHVLLFMDSPTGQFDPAEVPVTELAKLCRNMPPRRFGKPATLIRPLGFRDRLRCMKTAPLLKQTSGRT